MVTENLARRVLHILVPIIVALLFGALIAYTLFEANGQLFFTGSMCLMVPLIIGVYCYKDLLAIRFNRVVMSIIIIALIVGLAVLFASGLPDANVETMPSSYFE